MPSPLCEVKDGAGAYTATTNGVNVTPGNTVTIRLIDTSADIWSISCVYTDDTSSAATVTAALVIDTVLRTATFTAPAAGKAYIFRSVVNNGLSNGRTVSSYSTTFGIYTLVNGDRVLAANETTEGDATFGWIKPVNEIIRSGGGGGGTPGGSDGQFQYNNGGAFGGNAGLAINESTSRPVLANGLELTNGANTMVLDGTPTAARTITLPDATTTLVGTDTTQTLENKSLINPTFRPAGGAAFKVNNPANTFQYLWTPSAIAADRTITIPLLTGNDTLVLAGFSQTLTNKTIDAASNTISNIVNANVSAAAAIDYSKMGTGTQTIGAQQFGSTVDAKGTETTKLPVNVETTDATVTTLDSFVAPGNCGVVWTVMVAAVKSDGTKAAFYSRTAGFRASALLIPTQVGTVQSGVTLEDDSDWDCTIDVSGTSIRCRVTGKAGETIRWTIVSQRLQVLP